MTNSLFSRYIIQDDAKQVNAERTISIRGTLGADPGNIFSERFKFLGISSIFLPEGEGGPTP